VNRPSLSIVNLTIYHNLSVTDHSLTITKPDGKTTSSQVGKATAPAAVAAKVKEAKRDAVDRETLQIVESQLDHVTKGFDAVSVLFQYLVNDVSIQNVNDFVTIEHVLDDTCVHNIASDHMIAVIGMLNTV